MLSSVDLTPSNFRIPCDSFFETYLKKPVRRYGYPFYNFLVHQWLSGTYGKGVNYKVDQWLWGQRGNDYERHRRRVNRYSPLSGKNILIAGCGTGRDIPSWLPYKPHSLVGVDLFNYERAWNTLKKPPKEIISFLVG